MNSGMILAFATCFAVGFVLGLCVGEADRARSGGGGPGPRPGSSEKA